MILFQVYLYHCLDIFRSFLLVITFSSSFWTNVFGFSTSDSVSVLAIVSHPLFSKASFHLFSIFLLNQSSISMV